MQRAGASTAAGLAPGNVFFALKIIFGWLPRHARWAHRLLNDRAYYAGAALRTAEAALITTALWLGLAVAGIPPHWALTLSALGSFVVSDAVRDMRAKRR